MRTRPRSKRSGSAIVETVTAAILLIPLTFALLDMIVLVIANSMNHNAVKSAARAAASQGDGGKAFEAAQNALASFQKTSIIQSMDLDISLFDYPADREAVTVGTKMTVRLPFPFPGLSKLSFEAKEVEPIVGGD